MSSPAIAPTANRTCEHDLAEFVFLFGHQPDSYLATAPGRSTFWSEGNRGLVSYTVCDGFAMVGGGLICPPEERQPLLQQFFAFCNLQNWRPIFFFIPEDCISLFRQLGWFTSKIGEDTLLDTESLTFSGREYEWVRRQTNYCQRHGVTIREVCRRDLSDQAWTLLREQLADVCASSMLGKAQQSELKFLDGSLDNHELGYRRLFLAETTGSAGTRIEGYVVCNPIGGGRAWSTEIYRHRQDSVRGTVPYLFHQIALQLKREGVRYVSLCLAPGQNCEEHVPNERPFVRRMILLLRDRGSVFFDMQGICYFKSRFRPRCANVYICSPPNNDRFPALTALRGLLAIARTLGLWQVSPLRLLKLCFRRKTGSSPPGAQLSADDCQ